MGLKELGTGKIAAMHETQLDGAAQQCSTESAVGSLEAKPERCYESTDRKQRETKCDALDWSFLILKLFRGVAEQYVKKAAELLYSKRFHMNAILVNSKSLTFCSEIVRDSCNILLVNRRFGITN